MPELDTIATSKLALMEARSLKRVPAVTERGEGVRVLRNGREYISFSCNDYLGLTHHPEVIAASQEALARHGAGAGASRLITGNSPLYGELEAKLAEVKRAEAACVFGSGYLANLGAITALVGTNDLILADRFSHACMLDGARLSGATVMRFAHNSLEHCAMLLEAHRSEHQHCLILTETVFSMDGDRAPVAALKRLAEANDAWLMTDDAHGLGVLSPPEAEARAHVQMGTLSKAVGSYGGYVCGSESVIALLKTSARSLMFSTGLPPAVLGASLAALKIIRKDTELVAQPLQRARLFTSLLGREAAQSAIVPVVLGEVEKALAAAAMLEQEGYLVSAIRPPTVPENTSRLRFAFSAKHDEKDIRRVASLLKERGLV